MKRSRLLTAWLLAVVAHGAPYEGTVSDDAGGAPLANAVVRVVGTLRAATTDDEGRFRVEVPPGFRWLATEAVGYGTRETQLGTPVRLWPLVADAARVRRRLGLRRDTDRLDDPDLTDRARAYLRLDRRLTLSPREAALVSGRAKGAVVPPETIRLYRRGDERDDQSCSGRVDVLPLEEYVRGVVPHEWIPSWHPESLNAGAVAARGYAWGWIERGGKYRCADLDDTTRSQVYRDDRDARGDAAVEATRGQGIVRDGVFIPSEYSAENGDPTEFGVSEPLCTGLERRGHGRGMCQWGTQRWATQRDRDYVWMVEHYFPGASVSRPEPPGARVELRQRLARVDPQPCADPEGTFDCADFVREGRSRDLFDLYVGQRMRLTVELHNTGGATAHEVALAVDLPGGLLAADAVAVDDVPREPDGGAQRLDVGPIEAGQTRRVSFTLRGARYSVPTGGPATVRAWVRQIDGLYDKPTWEDEPRRNEGQRFNGGDLRLLTEIDVYDPHRWTWRGGDPELLEGWRAVGDVASLSADEGLRIEAGGEAPTVESPYAPIDADQFDALHVGAEGHVWWRAAGQGFEAQRSRPLRDGVAELGGAPGWVGRIEQIRLVLGGAVHLGEVRFDRAPDAPAPDARAPTPRDAGPDLLQAVDARNDVDPDGPRLGAAPGATSQARSEGGCRATPGAPPLWVLCLVLCARRR